MRGNAGHSMMMCMKSSEMGGVWIGEMGENLYAHNHIVCIYTSQN